jgi:hypothetical protein
METLDHLSQPVAFATAPLGVPESSSRPLGRNGSNSSDTDIEENARSHHPQARGQTKVLSPDLSFATAYEGENGRDIAKSTRHTQSASVVDLRNEFDEIAEEGQCLHHFKVHG